MNYGKKSASKKHNRVGSKSRMRKKKVGIGFFKIFLLIIILAIAGVAAAGGLMVKRIIDKAPDITKEDVKPSGYTSTIYDSDGKEIQTLVTSGANRIYVNIEEVPDYLQKAFVAIEDERFYEHNGIDPQGIIRAGVSIITSKGASAQGASTITQQLIKNNVFPNFVQEDGWSDKIQRKLQEQYLALKLEKIMTKDEILENYMNTINLGQNTLGIQSAANRYFGKSVSDLTLSECAVIAGTTQNPEGLNPLKHPDKNKERRKKVLKHMLEQKYITQDEYQEALDDTEDVYKRIEAADAKFTKNNTAYSYFVDELVQQVIEDLQDQLGYSYTQAYSTLYGSGVSVYSTQDTGLQKICDNVINDESNYPLATRYSIGSYALTITRANGDVENYSKEDFEKYLGSSKKLYYSPKEIREDAKAYRKSLAKKGDKYDQVLTSAAEPQVSFTLMDQKTGYVKAIVGGRGKKRSSMSLNRATDTTRQPGSTFKILSTYAPALDTGAYTLASTERDEPYSYTNGRAIKNAYSGFKGSMTIRNAISISCNIIAVKVLTDITPQVGFDYLQDFGFTTLVENENGYSDIGQPLALGGITKGVTNLELTAAYASIANNGVYTEPVLYSKIVDHDGNVLIDNTPETHKVIGKDTAYNLTSAMEDVVKSGTGTPARLSNMACAGKTGTTSDSKDLWFCGFTPYYTAGIWTGYDDNQQLSSGYSYHKTMWKKIMEQIVEYEHQENKEFKLPSSVQPYTVCSQTGLLAGNGCTRVTEYFTKDSAPTEYCKGHYVPTQPDEDDDDGEDEDPSGNGGDNGNNNTGGNGTGTGTGTGGNGGGNGGGSGGNGGGSGGNGTGTGGNGGGTGGNGGGSGGNEGGGSGGSEGGGSGGETPAP